MDALSRLLMLNAPQGTIDKNCVLGSDWQLRCRGIIGYSLACVNARSGEAGNLFTLRPGNDHKIQPIA